MFEEIQLTGYRGWSNRLSRMKTPAIADAEKVSSTSEIKERQGFAQERCFLVEKHLKICTVK
uniref:hypothetical protein n=1 Tax=Polaromonas sp. H8N TaxID=1840297 RepID=UPI0015E7F199|nr:hypothetical protein [Polaromonas sp. H8N]